jgi:iron complex outermembrane receptor protein
LILIDGHPQYQGIFGHPLPDAYVASDVEKVEIIRGPASILYGTNAMGGVVNIITKKQREEGLNASLQASYGSFNTQKYAGTAGFRKNGFSVFASVNHDQTDGTRENTDFKITNGYTKVGYKINENFELTADISLAHFNANDNGSVYEAPAPFNINITRGKTALSLENSHKFMQGAFKIYHNFGEHDLSDGWHSTDRNSGIMLYQTASLFEGNRLTIGAEAKQYGGIGSSGMAADSLVTVNELGFYAYTQQTLLKKLSISAGLRLENNSNYGLELIPMAGINFNPASTTSLKASVSKGFRSPTIMEMYLFAPNPELEPERMMNYEISWIQKYLKSKLSTELTLFYATGENMIQMEGQYPNVSRQNVGEFTNMGIEVATKFKATENFILHGNYTYLNLDKAVLAAPEHQFNINASYRFKIVTANLSLQHVENLYTLTDPEELQSYTLLNARIDAQLMKYINIFVSGNNLLNQEYEINYGYPMPGIHFSAGLKITL